MASGRLVDYLGSGLIADRPATPALAAGAAGLWFATDTGVLSAWDGSAWADVGGDASPLPAVVDDSATSYTVLAADVRAYRHLTNAGAKTVTVGPDSGEALPDNGEWHFDNDGAGDLTFTAGSGVTIKAPYGGTLVVPQDGVVTLKRLAADTFRLVGATVAA